MQFWFKVLTVLVNCGVLTMVSVNLENSPFPGGFDLRHRLKLTQEGLEEDLWYVTQLSIR